MKTHRRSTGILVLLSLLAACASPTPDAANTGGTIKLVLGAYTTPREAYGEIIPLFQALWKEKNGQTVVFEESYQASGAQSRAILEGFEADVAALSLEADITRLVEAGLITQAWKSASPYGGMVTSSVVAFAVRAGNPRAIRDWADLAQPGLEVLTPNPKTSGGAMWNILALHGAALRGRVAGVPAGDEAAALAFLTAVLKNVTVMDKGARESITTFEKGVGDVAITYENEVLVGQQAGQDYDLVLPSSSIRIENPVAVVDAYADRHGTRAAAEAFVAFLFTPEAQAVFAAHGLRAMDPGVAQATAAQYPPLPDVFSVQDQFGGWAMALPRYFGEQGIFTLAAIEAQK